MRWRISASQPCARSASTSGAAALPDDGGGYRLAAAAVPDEGGFALIGEPEGSDLGSGHTSLLQHLPCRAKLRLPQRGRVLLDPTRLRKVRRERLLRLMQDVAAAVEQQGAGAAGALIESQDVSFRHDFRPVRIRAQRPVC